MRSRARRATAAAAVGRCVIHTATAVGCTSAWPRRTAPYGAPPPHHTRSGKRGASKSASAAAAAPDGLASVKRKLRSEDGKAAKRGRKGSEWRWSAALRGACRTPAGDAPSRHAGEDSDLDDRDGPIATADMVSQFGVPVEPTVHMLGAAAGGAGAGAGSSSSSSAATAAAAAGAPPPLTLYQRDDLVGTFAVHALFGSDLRPLM